MTNQQKIEFYLKNGFAVQADEYRFCFASMACFVGLGEDGRYVSLDKLGQEIKEIKSITPILPNPYEFSVGERVMLDGGEIKTIEKVLSGKDYNYSDKMIYADGWYRTTDNDEYPWYQLAPALPEDEECEVVEAVEIKLRRTSDNPYDEVIATKPDGKKLKIKVIKK
jgi:hypothetical protein